MTRHRASLGLALAGLLLAGAAPATSAPAAKAPRPPRAVTGAALHVSDSTAEIVGTVNPRGTEVTYYFQYGPTAAYGEQTPSATAGGSAGAGVSAALSGLQPGTTYHYRVVATSTSAGTAEGLDRTFVTKQVPLRFVLPHVRRVEVYGNSTSIEGTLTGTNAADHQIVLQANPFPYLASFGDVGEAASTGATGGFSLQVPSLAQTTELRVRTLDTVPAYSQVVTVQVAARVTLHAKALGRQGLVRFSGTVRPAEAGAPVTFRLVRAGRGAVKVGTTTVRSAGTALSRFSTVLGLRRAGACRAIVDVSSGRLLTGESNSVSVHPVGVPQRKPRAHRRTLRARRRA